METWGPHEGEGCLLKGTVERVGAIPHAASDAHLWWIYTIAETILLQFSGEIFHDTAGWKNLETSMKCLEQIIEQCSAGFGEYVDKTFTDLVTESLYHTNRFGHCEKFRFRENFRQDLFSKVLCSFLFVFS